MAFTDDFAGTSGEDIDGRTSDPGWTKTVDGSYRMLINSDGYSYATGGGGGTGNTVYTCTDQGTADHYTQTRTMAFQSMGDVQWCVRLVDGDNFIAYRLAGTGGSGRRLSKVVSGTRTDLITSQGVDDEHIRIEAEGSTIRLYEGGTATSAGTWTQIGTDQTVTDVSTSETSQGIVIGVSNSAANNHDYFEAGALSSSTTYTYTPSGGITFAGSAAKSRTKDYSPSGGITLSGSASKSRTKAFSPSGGITLAGAAAKSLTKAARVSGGVTFGGAGTTSLETAGGTTYTYTPSGGVAFAGTAPMAVVKAFTPSGGVSFSGAATTSKTGWSSVSKASTTWTAVTKASTTWTEA